MYHRPMNTASPDVTAFVLAGGKSTRMGKDKAFVMLDGQTLLDRMLNVARSVAAGVLIVGDRAKFSPFAPVVEDAFPGCGPLAGIHAALRSSQTDLNLILAVDVPFLSSAFLEFLIARSRESTAIVTVVRIGKGWQPLSAVYRRDFADAAEEALRAGRYKIDTLFKSSQVDVIQEEDMRTAGFSNNMFRNLNNPEELADAGSH